MRTDFPNEEKAKIFHDYLGGRFKTFEVATENAPISFLAKDNDGKEYYVHVEVAPEKSVTEREFTGIKIANTHFYHLYGMASQGMNIFWFEAFEDGYMIFYLNDCLTPEQLKVTDEFTMIGVASALHVEKPVPRFTDGENNYIQVVTPSEPSIIQGSLSLPKTKITKKKKR
jgi:hypothetical protein